MPAMSRHPLWDTWKCMLNDHGDEVCPEWLTFDTFAANIGSRPGDGYVFTRIDTGRPYGPGNVYFETKAEFTRLQLGMPRQRCEHGHLLVGWNRKPNGNSYQCRTCHNYRQCARHATSRGLPVPDRPITAVYVTPPGKQNP